MALLTSTTTTAVRDPSAASFGDEKASVFTNSTTEMAIHALRKDEDGLLYYTKVKLNSNDDITMAAGGLAYSGLSDIVANQFKDGTPVNDTNPTEGETGLEQHENNKINRFWNQHQMKMDKYQYFINTNGMFVMRFLGTDYSYGAQDGSTANWIKA